MKRLLMGLAMLAVPTVGQAQIVQSWGGFELLPNGFNYTTTFRNVNQSSDEIFYGSGTQITAGVSGRVYTWCTVNNISCTIASNFGFTGPIGINTFQVNNQLWVGGNSFGDYLGCGGFSCFINIRDARRGFGIIGCKTPAFPTLVEYSYRTCDADGLTGSITLTYTFRYSGANSQTFAFNESDLTGGLVGSRVVLTPEPATWALLLFAFAAISLSRRKLRCSK